MPKTSRAAFGVRTTMIVLAFAMGCDAEPVGPPPAAVDSPQTAEEATVRVVRVIEPLELDIVNPAGLAYSPAADLLLVTRASGGVEAAATDVDLVSMREERAGRVRLAAGISDPVNITFDGRANRLLVFQSAGSELIEVPAGGDGRLQAENLRLIDAETFGARDPQGLAVDPATGRLFLLDAAGPRILVVEPHPRFGLRQATVSAVDLDGTGLRQPRGLALDPTTGHLHVLDRSEWMLHEYAETGRLLAVRDVSGLGFTNPQGMTFAPSGDRTDDPAEVSLYVADSGLGGTPPLADASLTETGHITELSLAEPMYSAAGGAGDVVADLVRSIDLWRFRPPSPDAAGVVYLNHSGRILVSDSEVNEMSIYDGANLFEIALQSGSLQRTYTTYPSISDEPTGVAYNPSNRHLFFSDDTGTRSVYELDPGSDGQYMTSDDVVTSIATGRFGSDDPEGVTYDSALGHLYIVDGVNAEVYRVDPGPNGVFDGVSPDGDDDVTHWDTSRFVIDPEGIAYHPVTGTLYLLGEPTNVVFEVTTDGDVLRTVDISAGGARKPAGLGFAPGSDNSSVLNLNLVARGTDNDSDPNENDGMLYEFAFSTDGNALPTVNIAAPADGALFTEGESIAFSGTADDAEDGDLTASMAWTSSQDGDIGTGGSFSLSDLSLGAHTITASVTDSDGREALATVNITVNPDGVIPVNIQVAQDSDDAEEASNGVMDLGSSDLELVDESTNQTVGIRFVGVALPQGATITNATIQFQADETDGGGTTLTIQGEASDNAAPFEATAWNVSSRSMTSSSVSWSPAPWMTVGEAGTDQQTPNIATVIQEIVSRPGWSSGNSLVIIVTGSGKRTAESHDGSPNGAPLLHVDYTTDSPPANQSPTADFTFVTTDLTVDFTDASTDTDGTIASWEWDFGDGTMSTAQNPSHSYDAGTSYDVTLTVTDDDGATSSTTQSVTVMEPNVVPTADFTFTTADLTADFTDTSTDTDGTIASWDWDFGDPGGKSTLQNPSHTYGSAGTYLVTLTVTDDRDGTSTTTQSVTVTEPNQVPTADFTWTTSALQASFTDASSDADGTIASWDWDFGDGNTATTQNPSHTYSADGTYDVMLTVTDDRDGTSTTTQSVTVMAANDAPVAAFTYSALDLTADFTDTSTDGDGTIVGWSWDFGDGSATSTAQNPSHTYPSGNTYEVTLTVTDDGGAVNSVTQSVTVLDPNVEPTADFTFTATDLTADFTDTSTDSDGTIVAWSWNFGDGGTSTAQNPSHTYSAAATYTVTLTVTDDRGGTGTTSQSVTALEPNVAPTADFTFTPTDLTVGFTDASTDSDGTIVGWSWNFGDGGTSTTQNPSHTYAAEGTYGVSLTATDDRGGTSTTTQSVTVTAPNVAPTADFTFTTSELTANFTDASTDSDGTIVGWSWDFGDGTASTAQNPSHTYGVVGTFTVSLTVTDNEGANSSTTQSVTVSEPVIVSSITPNSMAAGQSGVEIIISGSGFDPSGVTVSFEGGVGPSPDVVSATVSSDGTSITAVLDAKSGGPGRDRVWDVRVTNPNGGSGVLAGGFIVTP